MYTKFCKIICTHIHVYNYIECYKKSLASYIDYKLNKLQKPLTAYDKIKHCKNLQIVCICKQMLHCKLLAVVNLQEII